MRIRKWLRNALTFLMVAAFITVAGSVVMSKMSGSEPNFYGYQLKTVLSGSMEPSILTGSIVAIKPGGDMTRFTAGDVITFRAGEKKLITHRIIEVTRNKLTGQLLYRTKGDNNDAADLEPVDPANITGVYTGFTVPYAGYALNFAGTKLGNVTLLIIPGVLLFLYALASLWKTISALEDKKSDPNASQPDTKAP
ncbi:signal peptidase I SipW [Paenibacillus farraposensis]|uniref:Signal peptidase I n=1 Tax=Paenibacillus farraposensis TaxID=2807095 RepID=A0ABW4DLP7_9BACL|nr:signal peptidase I [Paenibacillus farraposensis]MCC3378215.1 signal peptidase I [Paenibacillus farraposensis]